MCVKEVTAWVRNTIAVTIYAGISSAGARVHMHWSLCCPLILHVSGRSDTVAARNQLMLWAANPNVLEFYHNTQTLGVVDSFCRNSSTPLPRRSKSSTLAHMHVIIAHV